MTKELEFEWADCGICITATLLEHDEPELCAKLWDELQSPMRLICRHPLSTGYEFGCDARPKKHPEESGTQAQPIGRKTWILSRIQPGSVVYTVAGGYGGIGIFYGPCTEPLPSRGAVVARVNESEMDKLSIVGKAVWTAQYISHVPMTLTARRGE